MHISKIILENFKGFKGHHEIEFNKGVNFFVGNNNCGKSTVFEAVEFIKTKRPKEEVLTKGINGEVSVIVEFKGDIEAAVKNSGLTKYENYIIDTDGEKSLLLQRSSSEDTITQAGKSKTLGLGVVRVFNNSTSQFENPTGADKTIGALFDAQFVWADTTPGDISDFGSTKICGRLLQRSTGDFFKSSQWTSFQDTHKSTFTEGADSLAEKIKPLAEKLETIMKDQYGETEVRFSFSLPDVTSFLKTGSISLSDDGVETASHEKGTGMQRALALSLIQVYADVSAVIDEEEKTSKPLLFFIDEPETFLHPHAQHRLIEAIEKISQDSQVFITTHSPYLLRKFTPTSHALVVFSKDGGNHATPSTSLNLFGTSSPTWGEINYTAFGLISEEFHNELYGFVQEKAIAEDEKYYSPKDFDDYLVSRGSTKHLSYIHLKSDGTTSTYSTTPQTYIRNVIHHPENTHNTKFTESELKSSIEALIPLI